jgi:hypothetical protein
MKPGLSSAVHVWIWAAVLVWAVVIVVIAQIASTPRGARHASEGSRVELLTAPSSRSEMLEDIGAVAAKPAYYLGVGFATSPRGWATYYDVRSGHAAAGPLLRIGDWRGRAVTVCAGSHCLVTRLTDWCACGPRHGMPTLIDLARSDFARLAPTSQGVVLVTVSGATLPATDTEE